MGRRHSPHRERSYRNSRVPLGKSSAYTIPKPPQPIVMVHILTDIRLEHELSGPEYLIALNLESAHGSMAIGSMRPTMCMGTCRVWIGHQSERSTSRPV